MATLTETAYYARKGIKYGAIGIVSFFIVRALLLAGIAYYRRQNPPPPPPPTVAFGKLPQLIFPEVNQPSLVYKLETITGNTPDLGDRADVYFMPVRQANLLALDRMVSQARVLDFNEDPEQLSPRRYIWTRTSPIPATMTADIISGSFSIDVAWYQDPGILSQNNLPDQSEALRESQGFLQNAGIFPEDLLTGQTKVGFYKADINQLVETVSLSEADFVRVDMFRAPIEDLLVYTPNPERGAVSLTFSGSRTRGKRVVELKYNYFPVNYEETETYPIKTSQTAWNELQAGEGYIASVDEDISRVTVRNITLGYYDSAVPQHYLQPIYVFEGDDNFVAYVQAVESIWLE